MMVIRRVQLNQRMVGAIHVGVEKTSHHRIRLAADVADVGDGRLKMRSRIELLLISRLHVLGAPSEVPDGTGNVAHRRSVHFLEQNPRLVRPHGVDQAREFASFGFELGGVELDVFSRIGGVQVQVMEMRVGNDGSGLRENDRRATRQRDRQAKPAAKHSRIIRLLVTVLKKGTDRSVHRGHGPQRQ